MEIQQFYQLTGKNAIASQPEIGLLRSLIEEYPFFQAAIFAYLKSLYVNNDESYKNELERLSISINDRRALFYYIFSGEYEKLFAETGKKEIKDDKTSILLNAFFESRDDVATELEYIASADYFSYTQDKEPKKNEKEVEEPKDSANLRHQGIIDSFISKSEEGEIRFQMKEEAGLDEENIENSAVDEDNEDDLSEDVFFTETLAKIYIKQKKYEKAYKIIKHLSLNYPKKNIYFADQLSFLEKLIINTKYKDKK